MRRWHTIFVLVLAVFGLAAQAAEPAYRTDTSNEKLPWYQLKQGEFPPAGSAHYISGELIAVDHVNRTGVLRQDRTGAQRTDEYDRPLPFALLPYGSVRYHGAIAELRDIPIGTHLHGQFYQAERNGKQVFYSVLKLEDDFSHMAAAKRTWRIEELAPNKNTLTVRGIGPNDESDEKPTIFQLRPATRVWKGRGYGSLADLAVGQTVLINLTVCTLKGPGRCTDIWIDDESRNVATAQQGEVHRLYQREHGLAGWVNEVDNKNRIVTVTLFDGFDPALKSDFQRNQHVAAAVAEATLRTHDQINDVGRGPIVEVQETSPEPGSSGIRLKFKPNELLEGYRPQRILRLFGNGWHVDDLPREEQAYDG